MSFSKINFFIVDHTPIGGVQRVSCSLIDLFLQNGIDVDYLISQRNNYEKPNFPYSDKVKYINLNCSTKDLEKRLYEQFVKLKIKNLIFSGDNMSVSIALLKAAKSAGVKAIPQYHGSPHAYLDKYISFNDILNKPILFFKYAIAKIFRPFKILKLKKYLLLAEHGLACVSKGSAEEIKKIYKNSPRITKNVFTIYNPSHIDIDSISCDVAAKKKKIVYLSRLEDKHKNSFLIVKSWNEIAYKYPDWELHILGDGSISDKMKDYVIKKKINNVVFHGMVTDIATHLSSSKISILSSNCEGLPTSIVESICYRNAIISTMSNGGIIDLVENEISGLLVPRNDHKAFGRSMERLMTNDALRNQYIEESYKVLQKFTNEKIVLQWKERFNL
ncbi:glycosyltransferase involved in cell wall biosynthesis [Flavobacterium sp. 28A]|uniref:glycosyltransferase n=1 Tax=Flavobacterium sp. 28A TaxID=2735895 RepID=UPI00156ED43C|nr:glycosyltransferase [Flavobacterium sp. 28A]NRT15572.1 glycosyltransferase involved in cell wall biosynthesis [Flavobacterium sp. 28A]